MIARQGEETLHDHPAGELELCRGLAEQAAKVMEGVVVGMGSEGTPFGGTDYFLPFFVTANKGVRNPTALMEARVREIFGGVIYPECPLLVEDLANYGEWWESVRHDCSDYVPGSRAMKLGRWRDMIDWFNSQPAFRRTAFVTIEDRTGHSGATFPRLAVGVTTAGSLAGIFGCVVHT
jgi:hypothetical protein